MASSMAAWMTIASNAVASCMKSWPILNKSYIPGHLAPRLVPVHQMKTVYYSAGAAAPVASPDIPVRGVPLEIHYTLRQLQYLVAVSHAGTLNEAASRCYVSPPALSLAISAAAPLPSHPAGRAGGEMS